MISGDCVEPVSSRIQPTFFPYSLSVSPTDVLNLQPAENVYYELETGDFDDVMYINDVNEVDCTENEKCDKRISCAGPEWTVGQLGNRPIGTRDAAHNPQTCLGPYAIRTVQSPHTGHNTHEFQASSTRPQNEDQDNTSQPTASPSRRFPAAEDRASPAIVALHPRKPPYFTGGANDDVHMWTSIRSRWFDTIQGEPST